MNSCGLSKDKALSASKKVHFETSSRPDSVLALLETNDFTKPYISKLITSHPILLLADPPKTLKPKLDFLISKGLSGIDLAKHLFKDPCLLHRSLENYIIPSFAILKSILRTDENVIAACKCSLWVLNRNKGKRLAPNIGVLRDQGVPESNVTMLLLSQPRTLLIDSDKMKEIKGMGLDPSLKTFVYVIRALTSMRKSTREAKLDFFRSWGWSEEEIQTAFRKEPHCMTVSGEKIEAIMDFLVNQMGFSASLMVENPNILLFSLEKRIIPRCLVLRILVSKGLVKKEFRVTAVLATT